MTHTRRNSAFRTPNSALMLVFGVWCLVFGGGCSTPPSTDSQWPRHGWTTNEPSYAPITNIVAPPVFKDIQ